MMNNDVKAIGYDGNGNQTNDAAWSYSYDRENRLLSASSASLAVNYSYDAQGRLIERRTSGATTTTNRMYYAGWQLIAEYDGAGTLQRKYVYGLGIDEPVRMTTGGTNYYYHADGLGSVTEITDSTGGLIEQYRYDVFGSPAILAPDSRLLTSSAIGNRLLFTGRDRDPDSGLYNYRNRYYNPSLGRFVQPDPIGIKGGDVNLYRYCANNPVNLVDPNGLCKKDSRWSFYKWLYTGDGYASDEIYRDALNTAGAYLYNDQSVRGFYIGAGTGAKFEKGYGKPAWVAGAEVGWTMDSGYYGEGSAGLGRRERTRDPLTGQYVSTQAGVQVSVGYSEGNGGYANLSGYGGSSQSGNTYRGGSGGSVGSGDVKVGINLGVVQVGIIIDPSKY